MVYVELLSIKNLGVELSFSLWGFLGILEANEGIDSFTFFREHFDVLYLSVFTK